MNLLCRFPSLCNATARQRLSWPLILASLFFLTWLANAAQTTLMDPDTYLHITIGHRILEQWAIPTTDPFSHSMSGAPWVAHEWLSDILLALTHDYLGWAGLHTLTIGLCALTLAYLLRYQLDWQVPPIYAIFFTILTATCLLNHLLARPHLFTWPILVIWCAHLLKASETSKLPPWWLIGMMVLWANLHGSYVLGLAILPLLGLDALYRCAKQERIHLAKAWGVFALVATLSTLCTPYGWRSFLFFYDLLTQPDLSRIDEWAPVKFSTINGLELWIYTLLGLGCLGLLRLSAFRLLFLAILLHEALTHVRYISIFGLLVPLLIAEPFQRQYARFISRIQLQESAIDTWFKCLSGPASRVGVGSILAMLLGASYLINTIKQPHPPEKFAPKAALTAAREAGLQNKAVFNDYPFGGYLIYEGIPVFIDGRADMYGAAFLKDYFDAIDPNHVQKFSNYLDSHQVAWTLLPPNNYLVDYLSTQPGWKKIYADKYSVIHQRAR